jgi:hypothetical protein
LHLRVGCFVLLSDRYDAELAADFESEGRFVLTKPLEETEVQRVLASMDSPANIRNQVV